MKTIRARGLDFAVHDSGQGPPVLLIHGFPLNHTMWSPHMDELAATRRVIAPDLRGFGGSQTSPGVATMEDYADDLFAILDALEVRDPVTVCGFSMGGYIAFAFWKKYASRVRGMVLCDTRASADTPEAAKGRRALAERVLADGHEPVLDAMLGKLFAPETSERDPGLIEQVREMIESNSLEGIAAALRGMAGREDATALLPKIDVPVLVIVGAEDAIIPPAEMRDLANAMPRAALIKIPDAGHMTPMENPQGFRDALASPEAAEVI
jgi:pimeloyl-ACP methyl ester carboxylesterase